MGLAGYTVSNLPHLEILDEETRSVGMFVVVNGCLAVLLEVALIVVRFLNIGIVNLHMRKFFIAVRLCVSVCLLVHVWVGVHVCVCVCVGVWVCMCPFQS